MYGFGRQGGRSRGFGMEGGREGGHFLGDFDAFGDAFGDAFEKEVKGVIVTCFLFAHCHVTYLHTGVHLLGAQNIYPFYVSSCLPLFLLSLLGHCLVLDQIHVHLLGLDDVVPIGAQVHDDLVAK